MNTRAILLTSAVVAVLGASALTPSTAFAQPAAPQAPPPALEEKIAAIKQAFTQSQAKLRGYQWIQTTTLSKDGEGKKTKTDQCYYGVEGTLVKVPLSENPPEGSDHERGLRGKIKEEKKEELRRYVKNAEDIIREYLPPNPALIQQANDAGNASIRIIQPGVLAAVDLRNYLNPGDLLSVEFNLADNRIVGVSVATTMGENQDPVTMNVTMGAFPDGTQYTAQTQLICSAKNVTVTTDNAGYTPLVPGTTPQQP